MNDQENEDVQYEESGQPDVMQFQQSPADIGPSSNHQRSILHLMVHNQPLEISDDALRESVRCLNDKQRSAYNIVLKWCREKIKNLNNLKPQIVELNYLFVTGGAGAGKSHLIKTIHHTAVKVFKQRSSNPELLSVLLIAPTGVAAININATTIHTALSIPKETGDNIPQLSDQKKHNFE